MPIRRDYRTETLTRGPSVFLQIIAQYYLKSAKSCLDEYLLWFHHLPWKHRMKSGNSLWDELRGSYYSGVESVREMKKTWECGAAEVDKERFEQVKMLLTIQEKEAVWWRNACVLYFQTQSKMPIPAGFEKPNQTLDYDMGLKFPYAPGKF